ncbi:hypothetical protein ACE1TI_12560 [Alteribacillus sp. JSM 102045]|uniref:hypothetical protein n=1 Tax=Alteribacillus sp. JSM 102045 TaxID=1562101 RepID=UPI0035C1E14B
MKLLSNFFAAQNKDASLPLREGSVYRANILERNGNNEAIINLRNTKIKTFFQGSVPQQNNVAFQVMGRKEGELLVRAISSDSNAGGKTNGVSISAILKNLGVVQPSNAVKNGAGILLQTGTALTKSAAHSLQNFMDKETGTTEQKLPTVQTAASKGIDITENNLRYIHETLHSKSAVDFMKGLTDTVNSSERAQTQLSGDDVNEAVKNAVRTTAANDKAGFNDILQNIRTQLQENDDPAAAIKQTREKIVNHSVLTKAQVKEVEKGVNEAEHHLSKGNASKAKNVFVNTLNTIEREIKAEVSNSSLKENVQDIRRQLNNGSIDNAVKNIQRRVLNHPELTQEQSAHLKKVIKGTEHLNKAGQERLNEALRTIEKGSSNKESISSKEQVEEALQKLRSELKNGVSIEKALQTIRDEFTSKSITPSDKESIYHQVRQVLGAAGTKTEAAEEVLKFLKQAQQLSKAGKERVLDVLRQIELSAGKIENTSYQENISSFKTNVTQEPDMAKVLNQLRSEWLSSLSGNVKNAASENINQAQILFDQGKELASRQQIYEFLKDLTKDKHIIDRGVNESRVSSYALNEYLHSSAPFESKQLLETRVTEKLIKVTMDFKQIKQDTLKQLEQASKLINQDKQSAPQVKQIVEAAIKKLDRTILRSDVMLFTDMKTERKLLQASGQLAEAKQLLGKGNVAETQKIVREVQESVDKLQFKPTEQKIKHFVTREEGLFSGKPAASAFQLTSDQARTVMQDPSSRQVFELVRCLGLNRESEIGQMLSSSNKEQNSQQHQNQQNMKDALLHLMKNEEEGSKIQQKANQALANLTGQQLMSKPDQGNSLQHLLFNLPVNIKDQIQQLQVYVQSRQEGDQLDWENCNLYFLIETPSLGETGIMVQAFERQLSVRLKNDQEDFSNMMSPLVKKTTEALSELGYTISDIKYQPLSRLESDEQFNEEENDAVFLPFYTEKGFDYKV